MCSSCVRAKGGLANVPTYGNQFQGLECALLTQKQ